jgi:hypothetical protein
MAAIMTGIFLKGGSERRWPHGRLIESPKVLFNGEKTVDESA